MRAFDLLSFILTVLGTYAVFLSLRLLLPYCVIQYVEVRLEKTEERLNEAEAENAIPSESEYRKRFVRYGAESSGVTASLFSHLFTVASVTISSKCAWRAISLRDSRNNFGLLLYPA
jgi:hypothetical protein